MKGKKAFSQYKWPELSWNLRILFENFEQISNLESTEYFSIQQFLLILLEKFVATPFEMVTLWIKN